MSRNNPAAKPARSERRDWRRVVQISLLALLAVDVAFFVLGFLPSTQTYAEQIKELESLREELKFKREAVAHLKKIESGLSEARRQDDEFYAVKFLPRATGYSKIMEEVDKLAQSGGVKKGSVAYSAAEIKGRSDLIAVGITTGLEGDYGKIVQFINRLEQSPLFLTVDSLGVSTGQTKTIKLAVKLVTYFRIGALETGGGKAAGDQATTRLWMPGSQLPAPN
jgi:Tfp pilus assembly protein PilO